MTKETFIKELDKILKRTGTIEELNKIKTEITEYRYNINAGSDEVVEIIDKHIKELKGDK